AVFLALEEQEKVENKTPLVNESLRKFLNTRDGRLVAGLVAEFLQFFNLDFTLAVFQPETSTFQGLDGRENLARDLGIIEAEGTVGGPLLLEVIRRCQQKEKGSTNGEANSEAGQSDTSLSSSEPKSRSSLHLLTHETKIGPFLSHKSLDVKDKAGLCPDGDGMEGDSFFDDPIPEPEKTYGCRRPPRPPSPTFPSPPPPSTLSSFSGFKSKRGNTVLKDLKLVNDKVGSLGLGTGEDDDYVDDFNSTSHRSEKSELSIGEEIEEDLSVEMDDINTSDKVWCYFKNCTRIRRKTVENRDVTATGPKSRNHGLYASVGCP
uniref:Centrosomal protein 43 n=1 Tax=Panthera tigris altaica TaxID=74533 RepID=A0A8C9JNG6_PANTA